MSPATTKPWRRGTGKPPRPPTPPFRLRMAARGISRWTPPGPEEPAHGFALRLAALHRHATMPGFMLTLGVNLVRDATGCLEALSASRFAKAEQLEDLRRWTPVLHGAATLRNRRMKVDTHFAFATLGGQTVRRDDWSVATRRFCPACLAEHPHHRAWFDLTFVRTCPLHGVPLTDRDATGAVVGWHLAAVTCGTDGIPLAAAAARLGTPPPTLEAYALGRMGVTDPTPNALLDGYPLHEVLEAAEMMGRLALGGRRRTMPLRDRLGIPVADLRSAGYATLRDGLAGARRLLETIAEDAPATAFGVRELFGWAYTGFSFKESLSIELRGLMSKVAADRGLLGRQGRPGGGVVHGQRLTIKELAAEIGCTEQTATHLAKVSGALLPHKARRGSPLLVARDSVGALKDKHAGSVTRSDAARLLRVSDATFAEIVIGGHVAKVGTRWGDEAMEDRFDAGEIEGFLERIPCRLPGAPRLGVEVLVAPHLVTVPMALEGASYDAGSFFTDVFDGRLVISVRTGLGRGLDDFRIEPSLQPIDHPFRKRCFSTVMTRSTTKRDGITQREACALLDVNPPTAKLLAELGHLESIDGTEPVNRRKLDPGSLEAFASRYAAGKLYAKVLGCGPSSVRDVLGRRGIDDLLSRSRAEREDEKLTPLYDRAELRLALGLARDPDQDDEGRLFWKEMATALGRNGSAFMVWQVHDGLKAMFSNATREWCVHIEYLFDEPQVPVDGYPDAHSYVVRAELRVDGAEGRRRVAGLAQAARTRRLPAPIRVDADEAGGSFRATLDAVVVNLNGVVGPPSGSVTSDGARDAPIVQQMLDTLKGTFQEGERPYDHGMFGLWPSQFRRL